MKNICESSISNIRKGLVNSIYSELGQADLNVKMAPVVAPAVVPYSLTSIMDLCTICRQTAGLGCGDAP